MIIYRTAVEYAGCKILGNSERFSGINNLRELFFDTAFLEYGNFSDLHKIVLQIRPGNLNEELQRSTENMDILDSTGRSPLSWAAKRGEAEAVRVLLEYGADPNNSDNTGMTPLHYAAQAGTPRCLLLLIEYGARIIQSTRGWTALHYACSFHDDLAYVKPLLERGADIDSRTYVGKTALSMAILQDRTRTAAFLIEKGADIYVVDKEGQSPLALSVKFGHFECMKLLLRSGAKHKLLSEGDDTLLHLVAKFPDIRIIEYLSACDLGDLDLDARNKDRYTARELIQIHNSNPEITLAFQRLLTRVAGGMDSVVKGMSRCGDDDDQESDSTSEIFEDAVE